ncbi:MAG: NAD(P)/FAD-dependent oxidoreductase [Candidatus Hatepunaea meridiana]|nr:NAD(P)/FAD-dependent oxidoreductase [Candidatus Hatepunaea meridiana]
MIDDKYDIVVVGGGPAGTMAGAAAAKAGAKTLILERDAVFGIPVRCAEGVAVFHLKRFFDIDEKYVAARLEGAVLHAPDGSEVPVASEDFGMILERTLFDRWLAENAARAGAALLTKSDVDGLINPNGRVEGVYFTRLNKRYKVKADVVIAADGVESRVARWAGIPTHLKPVDLESTYQYLVVGIDDDHNNIHIYLGNEIAPGGYVWVFPKGKGIANVGIGVLTKYCDGGTAFRKLNEFIANRYGKVSIIGEAAGGVPVARPLKNPVKDGFMITGDAARHCNPVSGGGIAAALIGGNAAGEVAAAAVAKGDITESALKVYLKRIDKDIVKYHRRTYRLKEGVIKLTDDMLNKTAHNVLKLPPEKRTIVNIFLRGLASQPKLAVDIIKAFI